ncbi:MAG: diadenylate cyclase CdaA [Bacillota bacterium]
MLDSIGYLPPIETAVILGGAAVLAFILLFRVTPRLARPWAQVARGAGFLIVLVFSGLAIVAFFPEASDAFNQVRYLPAFDLIMALVDITVVAYVLYRIFTAIRGTRAVQLLKGVMILVVATAVSQALGLTTVNWLLRNARLMLFVALPVVFQPELRRALEQLGRGQLFARTLGFAGDEEASRVISEVIRATEILSRNKTGALIVLERETGLGDHAETGVKMDALVSAELLVNVFEPNTPLHDGAVILRGGRVMAASCYLPLTDALELEKEMGGRHRAAMGITEHSDCVAIVVSEETGNISLANEGNLTRRLDSRAIRELLMGFFHVPVAPARAGR